MREDSRLEKVAREQAAKEQAEVAAAKAAADRREAMKREAIAHPPDLTGLFFVRGSKAPIAPISSCLAGLIAQLNTKVPEPAADGEGSQVAPVTPANSACSAAPTMKVREFERKPTAVVLARRQAAARGAARAAVEMERRQKRLRAAELANIQRAAAKKALAEKKFEALQVIVAQQWAGFRADARKRRVVEQAMRAKKYDEAFKVVAPYIFRRK